MAKGQIHTANSSVTFVGGSSSQQTPVKGGDPLEFNQKLNLPRSSEVKFYFLSGKKVTACARTWCEQRGGGIYTFPCQLKDAKGEMLWTNGKESGCKNFRVRQSSGSRPFSTKTPVAPLAALPQEQAIRDLVDRNIMKGTPGNLPFNEKYRPNDSVTRAQFASLVSAANAYWQIPENPDRPIPLTDVAANHWARSAIIQAVRTGFLSGYTRELFAPDEPIPRQQVLAALAGGLGLPRPAAAEVSNILRRYQDANQIADWAKSPVAAAIQAGLMINEAPILNPVRPVTRGETAILISQALAYKEKQTDNLPDNPELLTQPADDPNDPPYNGPELWISPVTQELTLVHVNAADEAGTIVVYSLTATVQVIAKPTVNRPAGRPVRVEAGQSLLYRFRNGNYEGFVTVIEMNQRRSLIDAMSVFLADWSEAQPIPKAQCEQLFNDRLLSPTPPLSQPNLNQAIVQAMNTLGKFSTLPFIAPTNPPGEPGENSCGWAVNQVLAQARIERLDTYVPRVEELLKNGRGIPIKLEQAQAGDIVIAAGQEHMGICTSPTTVRSASKDNRNFSLDTDLKKNFYLPGSSSRVYRLQS